MRAFEYASPTTKEQAVSLLSDKWGETEVLGGGTDLLALMKDDVVHPKRLVNIKEIPELKGISPTRAGFRIGALTTIQELVDNPAIKTGYRALIESAEEITSPQIRAMGTVGGDLCQRPRCWYFRAGYGLLAKDEQGAPLVPGGDNRYHAILGNDGPAYFVNPSSLAPALIAYGAKISIFGPNGSRDVPAEEFFVVPKSDGQREYGLKPNEIVTEIRLPLAGASRSATYEVRQREALDWPLATASVVVKMTGAKVSSARIVLGHVAPTPWRSKAAEDSLTGKTITEETAQQAGEAAVSGAKNLGRNGYKIQLARVAVKRALLKAARGGAR
ncbi:MAG TPA: xanthine dehydrogenase family protein subunit M [Blastocatellia bacterium]|nr:xanthine dehydrogenase family protein subunit M [Blastocatellia bacterium]